MSINETQYKIDMDALQRVLGILRPHTSLTITAESVVLTEYYCGGQVDSEISGSGPIAKKLDAVTTRFYEE